MVLSLSTNRGVLVDGGEGGVARGERGRMVYHLRGSQIEVSAALFIRFVEYCHAVTGLDLVDLRDKNLP